MPIDPARPTCTPSQPSSGWREVTRRILAFGVALGLASPLAAQRSDSAEAQPLDSTALEGLRAELDEIVAASPVPGVAVGLVTRSGPVWTAGFGQADAASRRPATPATLFRTNSVSKSLVALAVLRVRERGALRLEAPLRELAPDIAFENAWSTTHPLRLAHLLEHTSGFDELHLREYAFEPGDGSLLEALTGNPAPRTARWPPGTRMAYNNGGYAVVAQVLETVTGRPFGEVVAREILEPLGMSSSGFGLDAVDRDRLAVAYLAPDRVEPTAPYPLLVQPAGAFISSADDLAQLVHFFLRRGAPLLQERTVMRMETPATSEAARAGLRVGYGLGSYTAPALGHVWHGHAGGTPSAYARYAYEPALGVGYVVLMNGNDGATRRRIEAALQGALVPRMGAQVRDGAGNRVGDGEGSGGSEGGEGTPGGRGSGGNEDSGGNEGGEGSEGTGGSLLENVDVPRDALAGFEGVHRQSTSNWQLTAALERWFDVRRIEAHGGVLLARPLFGGVADTLRPVAAGDPDENAADRGHLFRIGAVSEPAAVFLRDAEGVLGLRTWHADNLRAGNYERVPAVWAYGLPLVLALNLVLMLSAVPVAFVRGAMALARPSPTRATDRPPRRRALASRPGRTARSGRRPARMRSWSPRPVPSWPPTSPRPAW